MPRHIRAVLAGTAGLVLVSCAALPPPTGQAALFYEERKAKAGELMRQGRLAEARVQWRILRAFNRDDPDVAAALADLGSRIARESASHVEAGEKALRSGGTKKAWRAFLRALALDPWNSRALAGLRQIETASAQAYQIAQTAKLIAGIESATAPVMATQPAADEPARVGEQPDSDTAAAKNEPAMAAVGPAEPAPEASAAEPADGGQPSRAKAEALDAGIRYFKEGAFRESIPALKTYLAANPKDDTARRYIFDAFVSLAQSSRHKGALSEALADYEAAARYAPGGSSEVDAAISDIKARLAEEFYESGIRVFRDDVGKAIEFWEKTLYYAPNHAKAARNLQRAYTLQKNLNNLDAE